MVDRLIDRCCKLIEMITVQRLENRVLALEVIEEGGSRHLGSLGDVVDGRAGETLRREQNSSSREQPVVGVALVLFSFGNHVDLPFSASEHSLRHSPECVQCPSRQVTHLRLR